MISLNVTPITSVSPTIYTPSALEDETFVKHQKRRAQTEGRISMVKHVFLKRVFRQKGFENKERSVNWGIFAHNLTVLFRIRQEYKKKTLRQIAL